MKKTSKIIIVAIVIVILVGGAAWVYSGLPGPYDDFAKCLTNKGAKMYGAFWCPHCQEQKELFGSSFKYVNYIECSLPDKSGQTQACIDAGIQTYPTWDFPQTGKTEGVEKLQQLSFRTGCQLPG